MARLGLLPFAAAAVLGCSAGATRPNVLLLVVDTLRTDRLGCYGSERETSPAIDALAAEGVRFERAYSTAPWTKPAIGSILTGLYPSGHGTRSLFHRLSQDVETLPEILGAHGYETAGVVSHVMLAESGFAQGFDSYSDRDAKGHAHVSTQSVTEQSVRFLERFASNEKRFFLFVHYFDPHYNYSPHPNIHFADDRVGRLEGGEQIWKLREIAPSMSEAEIGFLRDLYDEEIRFTDAGIGRLLARLADLGLADETLVVFTADHGEEFLERGWLGHTRTLYEELIRVPLIIRAPSGDPGIVSEPVSTLSLAPTILQLLGMTPGDYAFQGESFAGLLRGRSGDRDRIVFAEVDRFPWPKPFKKAIVSGRFKLIRDESSGEHELYDLAHDPLERRNLIDSEPQVRERLLRRLEQRIRHARDAPIDAPELALSERDRRALRELGYLESRDRPDSPGRPMAGPARQ